MNKVKIFLKKYCFILLAVLILIISALSEKILNYHNIDFRNWLKVAIIYTSLILLFLGIIVNIKKKSLKNIIIVCVSFAVVFGIFRLKLEMVDLHSKEIEINSDYGKKVVYVDSFFGTTIEIHDYYNKFLCSKSYIWDSYDGGYDYVDVEHIERTLKQENESNTNLNNK